MKIEFYKAACVYENDYFVVFDVSGALPHHKKKRYKTRDVRKIDRVVFHHSAGNTDPPPMGLVAMSNFIIKSKLLGGRGWPAMPYHVYVPHQMETMFDDRFVVYLSQRFEVRSYHTLVYPRCIKSVTGFDHEGACNDIGVSVCFQGLFDENNDPSYAQQAVALPVWNWLRQEFNLYPTDLWGHYHYGKDACPGPWLKGLVEDVRCGRLV